MLTELFRTKEHRVDVLVFRHLTLLHCADFRQADDSLHTNILLLCLAGAFGFLLDANKVALAIISSAFFFVSAIDVVLSDPFPISENNHTDRVGVGTGRLVDTESGRRCVVFGASRTLAEVEGREDVRVVGEGDGARFGLHLGDLRRLRGSGRQGSRVLGVGWVGYRRQRCSGVDVPCWGLVVGRQRRCSGCGRCLGLAVRHTLSCYAVLFGAF